MICVEIDVAKDKHDCFILSSEGEVLADVFTTPNNTEGFDKLLKTVLCEASKGRYGRDRAVELRDAAGKSISSCVPAKSLELKHTIQLIQVLDAEIEAEIEKLLEQIQSPITSIKTVS